MRHRGLRLRLLLLLLLLLLLWLRQALEIKAWCCKLLRLLCISILQA